MQAELIRDEGIRYTPYKDSLGNYTIGVGHLLVDKAGIKITDPKKLPKVWPKDTIYLTLAKDILEAYNSVKEQPWYVSLDSDNRRRAIINMAFNLGHRLYGFHEFLGYLSKKQWGLAANDLNGTLWREQVHERANRIIGMIRNG